ncbi:MAG: hypothetical protein JST00_28445 [Deltaproteobacteria bacterium]|nr:hypothetical protein [Deltaproteobacteria bacterium]
MHSPRTSLLLAVLALAACRAPGTSAASRTSSGDPSCQPLAGGCVPLAIAARWCGGRSVSSPRGCVPRPPCERGRARELTTGECLPHRDVRALAIEIGLPATADDDVVCEKGELVASTEDRSGPHRLGCTDVQSLPSTTPGARGGRNDGEGEEEGFVVPRGGEVVDIAAWRRRALGADGGPGTRSFCAALARQPGALAASSGDVHVEIALGFPNNDVSQVVFRSRPLEPQAGMSEAEASVELERTVGPVIEALRGIGGRASEAASTIRVRCRRSSTRPMLEGKAVEDNRRPGG